MACGDVSDGSVSASECSTVKRFTVDYVKPNLKFSPDKVILHVGTNDLKRKEPQQVAGSAVDLGARETETSSDATVTISEFVSRRDGFKEALKTVNKQLNLQIYSP